MYMQNKIQKIIRYMEYVIRGAMIRAALRRKRRERSEFKFEYKIW